MVKTTATKAAPSGVESGAANSGVENKVRCDWCGTDPDYVAYHDTEWGVPTHDDTELFEFLILEGAQAGLSWSTILKRRDGYREAYADWDPKVVASFTDAHLLGMRENTGIVRNKAKIAAARTNAQAFLEVQESFGSFDAYIWNWVDGKPIVNRPRTLENVPATTELSEALSRDLRARGFTFVGPTIMYAYLQSMGLVNDHLVECFRHGKVGDE